MHMETTPVPPPSPLVLEDVPAPESGPVQVVAAESLPVKTVPGRYWQCGRVTLQIGARVRIVGDHPARTRFVVTAEDRLDTLILYAPAEDQLTRSSAIFGLTELTARGEIWATAIDYDPDNPVPEAHAVVYWMAEYRDG